mmetsp:Transcript_49160/g.104631  ORF Transcript_49160/g.104631 Transcript_49160/m.104631 type:complete len:83 (-) Transcript_49160:2321-2569(-)
MQNEKWLLAGTVSEQFGVELGRPAKAFHQLAKSSSRQRSLGPNACSYDWLILNSKKSSINSTSWQHVQSQEAKKEETQRKHL